MKTSLVAAFASVLSVAAFGCIEQDESSVDPALVEAIERDSGFDVILVEVSGLPKAVMGEHGEDAVIDEGGLSYAPRPSDEFVGGSDLVRDQAAGSNFHYDMYPIGEGQRLPMYELETAGMIDMHELETGNLIQMHELEFPTMSDSSSLPADPCDCAGDECRVEWVETNMGCDVCAVFVCGGDNTPHACNACP